MTTTALRRAGEPAAAPRARDLWTPVLVLGALGNLANALWMLVDPAGWYAGLPAAVPDFGPLNEHFVRDVGSAFAAFGLGLLWAAFVPAARVPVLALTAFFYVAHALVHVYDTARGVVGPEHWAIDLPAVYAPALFLVALTWLAARREAVAP